MQILSTYFVGYKIDKLWIINFWKKLLENWLLDKVNDENVNKLYILDSVHLYNIYILSAYLITSWNGNGAWYRRPGSIK